MLNIFFPYLLPVPRLSSFICLFCFVSAFCMRRFPQIYGQPVCPAPASLQAYGWSNPAEDTPQQIKKGGSDIL